MSDGAAENRRMRLDVHLHLAGEDRAYLTGLLLGVECRGVATPTRGRGLSTFIKAFCAAALVAVVAGASYRAGAVGNASRIITTEAGSARNLLPNPETSSGPGEIPAAFARGLKQPPEIIPAPGEPVSTDRASGPAAFGLKE
ncbi:MAG: hypothetical protein ABSD11_10945 [Methylocella sp.]